MGKTYRPILIESNIYERLNAIKEIKGMRSISETIYYLIESYYSCENNEDEIDSEAEEISSNGVA